MPGKAAGTEEEFATPSRFDSQGLLQRDMPEAGAGSVGTDGITARQAEIPPKVGLGSAWTNTKGIWKRSADGTIGLTNIHHGDPHTQHDPPNVSLDSAGDQQGESTTEERRYDKPDQHTLR